MQLNCLVAAIADICAYSNLSPHVNSLIDFRVRCRMHGHDPNRNIHPKPPSQLDNDCNTRRALNLNKMSLLALLGAYDSNIGSSPIRLLAVAIPLVLLNSHQIAESNNNQLETGATDFWFSAHLYAVKSMFSRRSTHEYTDATH